MSAEEGDIQNMADLETKEVTGPSNVVAKEEQPLQTTQEPTASEPALSTHVTSFEFKEQAVVSQGMERGHWACNAEFIMAALAVTTDYSLISVFPFLCYRNGGSECPNCTVHVYIFLGSGNIADYKDANLSLTSFIHVDT